MCRSTFNGKFIEGLRALLLGIISNVDEGNVVEEDIERRRY